MVWSGFDSVMVDTRRNTFVQRANLRPFTVCKELGLLIHVVYLGPTTCTSYLKSRDLYASSLTDPPACIHRFNDNLHKTPLLKIYYWPDSF